jgi:hypothetical protein
MTAIYPIMRVQTSFESNRLVQKSKLHKKKNSQCPNHLTCTEECYHKELHYRGTHCARDRTDECPTCATPKENVIRAPQEILDIFA